MWMRDKKDTLALGNITGAMVFQSTFPVAIGLAFTEWRLWGGNWHAAVAAGVAIFAGLVLYGRLRFTKSGFGVGSLLFGGFLTPASSSHPLVTPLVASVTRLLGRVWGR